MSLIDAPGNGTHAPLRLFRGPALARALRARDRTVTRDPDSVLWGVPRREGCTDLDDPRAHAGLTQHAFALGQDNRALCGFQPPRRRSPFSPGPRADLAAASPDYNPTCPACAALVERAVPVLFDLPSSGVVEVVRAAAAPSLDPGSSEPLDEPDHDMHSEPTTSVEPAAPPEEPTRSARRSGARRCVPPRTTTRDASALVP